MGSVSDGSVADAGRRLDLVTRDSPQLTGQIHTISEAFQQSWSWLSHQPDSSQKHAILRTNPTQTKDTDTQHPAQQGFNH